MKPLKGFLELCMKTLARSSTEYYKNKADFYLRKMDSTYDSGKYMYYYDEAIWWLFLYNESKKL